MTNLTPQQLRQAADIKERIDALQNQLNEILGGEVSTLAQATRGGRGRKVSAAGRARMRAAQLARWAKIKGDGSTAEAPKKRKMSAQGLANIRAGVAKRMAARGGAKLVKEPRNKRKLTPAMKAALEKAWAARRTKKA